MKGKWQPVRRMRILRSCNPFRKEKGGRYRWEIVNGKPDIPDPRPWLTAFAPRAETIERLRDFVGKKNREVCLNLLATLSSGKFHLHILLVTDSFDKRRSEELALVFTGSTAEFR
jgi:hypothetical protein